MVEMGENYPLENIFVHLEGPNGGGGRTTIFVAQLRMLKRFNTELSDLIAGRF